MFPFPNKREWITIGEDLKPLEEAGKDSEVQAVLVLNFLRSWVFDFGGRVSPPSGKGTASLDSFHQNLPKAVLNPGGVEIILFSLRSAL